MQHTKLPAVLIAHLKVGIIKRNLIKFPRNDIQRNLLDDLWESLFTACCELEIIKNQYE
jgi:hypothetical protein